VAGAAAEMAVGTAVMSAPLAVGLVGAGPWAAFVHAPVLAAGPETTLAAVWARRPEAAQELAQRYGSTVVERFEDLLDGCEAVAFAVPPSIQAELAPVAAAAGKALLLEKPIAGSVAEAERLAGAVADAGVGSLVVLSYRFADATRDFLEQARTFAAAGGRGCFISGAFLGGPFSQSPWRQERGVLLDVGPHIIDLLDAALGPVENIRAHTGPGGWAGVLLDHEGGARSEASMCADAAIDDSRTEVELFGPGGALVLDARAGAGPAMFATLRAEFAEVARTGAAHDCDVHRGLYLQRLIETAERDLDR